MKNTLIMLFFLVTLAGSGFGQEKKSVDILEIKGAVVERSVLQPLQVYKGESFKLSTVEGNIELDKCYGVAKVLKYEIKKNPHLLMDQKFTEKIYLLSETHDLGLFKYFEKSWQPDQNGVWSDALGLMSKTPLPVNSKRTMKQELYYGTTLVATHIIEFTNDDITFSIFEPDLPK